jgi:sortase A
MKHHIQLQPGQPAGASSLLSWSRNILFVIGIVALSTYGYSVLDARIFQAYQTQRFQQAVKEAQPSAIVNASVNPPAKVPSPVQMTSRSTAIFTMTGQGDSPLGQIVIPRIGLAVMIVEGTGNRALRRAVGHIPQTALPGKPGNVGIAGHRDTFFRNLTNIQKNDEITLTTLDSSHRYLVDFSEVVGPDQIEVLEPSANAILTLVTCYPTWYIGPAPQRLIVRAHMVPE